MKHTTQGDLFTEIVLEIFKLSGSLTAEGDKIANNFGLTSARWKILSSLARSSTPLTVPQIAKLMGQTRQAVQRLVDVMHNDELLAFLDNPHHKRAKFIELTATGKSTYSKLKQKQIPWANKYSNNINEKDLKITLETLQKISRVDV